MTPKWQKREQAEASTSKMNVIYYWTRFHKHERPQIAQ